MARRGQGHVVTYFDGGSKVVVFQFRGDLLLPNILPHSCPGPGDQASDHLPLDLVFASTFLMSRFWVWVTWRVMWLQVPGKWKVERRLIAVKDRIYYKVSVVQVRTNCKYCKTTSTWERRASHGENVYYLKYGAEQEIRDNPNKQNLATSPLRKVRESSLFMKRFQITRTCACH